MLSFLGLAKRKICADSLIPMADTYFKIYAAGLIFQFGYNIVAAILRGVGDSKAPSGNVYKNGNGKKVTNLGVHEHWNNSTLKQYSRNLGEEEGIELVYLSPTGETKITNMEH